MDSDIRYCTTADGVRIAYSTFGQGPVLVCPPGWTSHLEHVQADPEWQRFRARLAQHHTIVVYDRHGTGLSERSRSDFSLAPDLAALDAIVHALHLHRCSFFGGSAAGPVVIAYAAAHPRRVDKLVLYGTRAAFDADTIQLRLAIGGLIRAHWGLGSKTLAEVFLPGAPAAEAEAFAAYQRIAATAEVAARLWEEAVTVDVREQCRRVRAPTLVLHREDDLVQPIAMGRTVAALIPGAQFIALPGTIHFVYLGDSEAVLRAIAEFFGDPYEQPPASDSSASPAATVPPPVRMAAELSPRELEVLQLVAAGKSNRAVATTLVLSVRTVERHLDNIYAKTGAHGRQHLQAYALAHGLSSAT